MIIFKKRQILKIEEKGEEKIFNNWEWKMKIQVKGRKILRE